MRIQGLFGFVFDTGEERFLAYNFFSSDDSSQRVVLRADKSVNHPGWDRLEVHRLVRIVELYQKGVRDTFNCPDIEVPPTLRQHRSSVQVSHRDLVVQDSYSMLIPSYGTASQS